MDERPNDETVDRLLAEIGPLDESIGEVARDGEESWLVRVDDVTVEVVLEAEAGQLRLCTEIGVPPETSRARVYEGLLTFNSVGRRTGGLVMGLSEPGGSVLQFVTLPLAGLTPSALVTPVVNLADAARTWRALVVGSGAADAAPAAFDPSEILIRI